MVNSKKIKDFFDENIKRRRINKIGNRFNMSKIWNIILTLFVIVNIVIIAISSYLFFQIKEGEIFLVERDTSISIETINRTLMSDTIELFNMKAREFKSLKAVSKSKVIDPSL